MEHTREKHNQISHDKNVDATYKCDVCGKSFFHKLNLQRHLRGAHYAEYKNTITCCNCHEKFSTYEDLYKHLTEKHDVAIIEETQTFNSIDGMIDSLIKIYF